jgi:hypothetical protein
MLISLKVSGFCFNQFTYLSDEAFINLAFHEEAKAKRLSFLNKVESDAYRLVQVQRMSQDIKNCCSVLSSAFDNHNNFRGFGYKHVKIIMDNYESYWAFNSCGSYQDWYGRIKVNGSYYTIK